MQWLENVLEIRPIFKCDEIYWSVAVNEALTEETESNEMSLSYLVLDSLSRHFTGDWGEVTQDIKKSNDSALKQYFQNDFSGSLSSKYSNEKHQLAVLTTDSFSKTKIMFPTELVH